MTGKDFIKYIKSGDISEKAAAEIIEGMSDEADRLVIELSKYRGEPIEDESVDVLELAKKVGPLPEDNSVNGPGNIFEYTKHIAIAIWEKHYKGDSPQWEPLDTIYGMLSQIDNMITGWPREDDSVERLIFENITFQDKEGYVCAVNEFGAMIGILNAPPMKMILERPKGPYECQD